MTKAKIKHTRWPYFPKLLTYYGFEIEPTFHNPSHFGGNQYKISGYTDYNFLLDINSCLSTRPSNDIIDRTQTIIMPFKICPGRPWKKPVTNPKLEDCFENTVKKIESKYNVVNLLWSGGIDSTAMVVSWLKHSKDSTTLRVMFSIDSIGENSTFFCHLGGLKRIELIELGGNTFMEKKFDGCFVSGAAGDDITASVDESFFNHLGYQGIQSLWHDFFWKKKPNKKFIEFCEKYFFLSGIKIRTVLEARWFFYAMCKYNYGSPLTLLSKTNTYESFFYNEIFENYFYHNIINLFGSDKWPDYKKIFKNYIFDYLPDYDYLNYKCKENSGNLLAFKDKEQFLNKKEYIFALNDGTLVNTDNLPFFSVYEYRKKYQNQFDYLFQNDLQI